MTKEKCLTGLLIEDMTYTYIEVCQKYKISKEFLLEMVEQGFFPNQPTDLEHLNLDATALRHIESGLRLHKDLGINLAGVALALELLDEIESMRSELAILRKYTSNLSEC